MIINSNRISDLLIREPTPYSKHDLDRAFDRGFKDAELQYELQKPSRIFVAFFIAVLFLVIGWVLRGVW